MATEKEVHVLVVSLSVQGILNPMLMLAKLLVSKGLHVTLATSKPPRKMFHTGNISTTNSNFYVEFFPDGFSDDFDHLKNMDQYAEFLPIYGSRNLSEVINKLASVRKFSCIVNNPFSPWVADVASQHGIPCAMLWIQPCAVYSIYYHFFNDLTPFPSLENLSVSMNLPGLPLLDVHHIPSYIHPSNPSPALKKCLLDTIKTIDNMKWVLGNSFYELENEIVDSLEKLRPITPIGPLVPPTMLGMDDLADGGLDMSKSNDACLEWLDTKPTSSVVYISFGSLLVLSKKEMENIALALKSLNKPFLWVVKPDTNTTEEGMDELPSWFIEETREQGLVVPWCNQPRVLTHPSIACFMSHCGWNSLLEAIVSGVLVIGFPKWADQPTNSKLITDVFKTGIKIGPVDDDGLVSQGDVERCILEIFERSKAGEIKKQAEKLKDAARRAVDDGGSSDRNIQLFIDDISPKT